MGLVFIVKFVSIAQPDSNQLFLGSNNDFLRTLICQSAKHTLLFENLAFAILANFFLALNIDTIDKEKWWSRSCCGFVGIKPVPMPINANIKAMTNRIMKAMITAIMVIASALSHRSRRNA